MNDIAEQLRGVSWVFAKDFPAACHICNKAADEIERLRAALAIYADSNSWAYSDEWIGPGGGRETACETLGIPTE